MAHFAAAMIFPDFACQAYSRTLQEKKPPIKLCLGFKMLLELTSLSVNNFYVCGRWITQPPINHSLHSLSSLLFFWEQEEENRFTA